MRVLLFAGVFAVLTAMPVDADEAPDAQLDGIEAKCARAVVDSTWEVMRDQSWTQLAQLLSLSGATEMAALLGDTVRAELRECFAEVYRLGFEEGRRAEADRKEDMPSHPAAQ